MRNHAGIFCRPVRGLLSGLVVAGMMESARPARADAEEEWTPITREDVERMYPGSFIKEVTLEEFGAAVEDPATDAVVLIEPPREGGATGGWVSRYDYRGMFVSRPDRGVRFYVAGAGNVGVDMNDVAVVLIVVVASVVVAVAVVYTGVYLYKRSMGSWEGEEGWREAGLSYSFFSSQGRSGGMLGARVSGGLFSEALDVGLTLEGGYLHGEFKTEDGGKPVDVSAGYGLVGPALHWSIGAMDRPLSLDMSVLVGYTTDPDVDWIARAQVGFSWPVHETWGMGLHFGSLRIKVKETEGPLLHNSSYNLTWGLSVNRAF
ncbi:MAG TPA: hypothetical protein PKE55_03225 [Kiritimatiellia bacterium]|nr:hypothetical protein [Kiritimatiellia bacterium]